MTLLSGRGPRGLHSCWSLWVWCWGGDSSHWTALQGASVVTSPLQPEQQGADPGLTQSLCLAQKSSLPLKTNMERK